MICAVLNLWKKGIQSWLLPITSGPRHSISLNRIQWWSHRETPEFILAVKSQCTKGNWNLTFQISINIIIDTAKASGASSQTLLLWKPIIVPFIKLHQSWSRSPHTQVSNNQTIQESYNILELLCYIELGFILSLHNLSRINSHENIITMLWTILFSNRDIHATFISRVSLHVFVGLKHFSQKSDSIQNDEHITSLFKTVTLK